MDEHPVDGRPTIGEVWRALSEVRVDVTDHEVRMRKIEAVVSEMRGARNLLWGVLGTTALGALAMVAALWRTIA